MNSVTVAPSVLQPYKSDQVLEIDPAQPPTFTVINGEKSGNLPKLLEVVPSLIQELNDPKKYTTEQRSSVYQRVLMLESEVKAYNKELDDSFWIGVLQVILLVLTVGCFNYRESCKLEGPIGPEFGKIFGWGEFKKEYTVESFRALPKELQTRLSSLLNLSEADVKKLKGEGRDVDVANLLEDVDKVDSTLAEYLGEVKRAPKLSLQGFPRGENLYEAGMGPLASFVAGYASDKLIEGLGLRDFRAEPSEGGEVSAEGAKFAGLVPLLTKKQWQELPRPLFFLFAPHFQSFRTQDVVGFEPANYMTNSEFQDLYFKHDPDLKFLFALGKNMWVALHKHFGSTFNPSIGNAVANLSAAVLDRLIEKLFLGDAGYVIESLRSYIASEKIGELKPLSLATLYCNGRPPADFQEALKSAFSKFSADELFPDANLKELTACHKQMIPLLTEAQWKALPQAIFLLCAKATSQWVTMYPDSLSEHYGAGTSQELTPVALAIDNATFRTLYLERKLDDSFLVDLILGKDGGGAVLLQRLMPIEGKMGIALLTEISKLDPDLSRAPMIALIGSTLSQEQIANLETKLCAIVLSSWNRNRFPKVTDSNFSAWLERVIKEKNGEALAFLTRLQEPDSMRNLLNSKEASFLWSLFTPILAIPKQETKFYDMAALCKLISVAKWKEVIDGADSKDLIKLFESTSLPNDGAENREKITYALAKLRGCELSIPSQRNILKMFSYTEPHDQIGPLWGAFIKEKIDPSLSEYWKELVQKTRSGWREF